ncbi:MAG: DEAD/DEAH box helicase family protein [Euryarchaeota archaeon]|nr:DEAD/DEAH box helicase family protein [Euryarchaeota archaeon]MBU4608523.1 DEAD/DEAH box helicase family protein [Euryarchaeota archaeon]MBV1754539.1 DEAD/DEAH box helicase family protein [Methanobacterium sp.]
MDFRSLDLQISYDSEEDDILNKFYIPVLSNAKKYNRIVGFFNSSSLAAAAKGIKEFILNNGEMNLICGAKLHKNDIEIIKKSMENPEDFIVNKFLSDIHNLEDQIIKDHVRALGWMIAHKKLEIKIAIKLNEFGNPLEDRYGILHQKVGILTDNKGNKLSFSGSNNETFAGWNENIEEFKVFRSWKEHERRYMDYDIENFDKYWNEKSSRIKVIDIPEAIKNHLIKIAPKSIDDLNINSLNYNIKETKINLFDYQKKAISSWMDNGKKGIFEMATGTGKTYTALGCLEKINSNYENLITIITSPYHHLVEQWNKEISKFRIKYDDLIIADSSNPSWKNILSDSLDDLYLGYKNRIIILTTHRTLSSKIFIDLLNGSRENINHFLIADEVHGLGADLSINGLLKRYDLRLGLSATPQRWFDDYGTDLLYDYFGGTVFEFSLEKAIENNFLTPYRYIPIFVSLNQEELENYIEITKVIAVNLNKTSKNENKKLESLIFKRANIIKNSEQKYKALEEIMGCMGDVNWSIIYCTNSQIKKVLNIINKNFISAHLFTMNEGTVPKKNYGGVSEREYILKKFSDQKYKILVAMKCLDEGVDIPPARKAIFMSSSGNPREYIQRIGRIIRKYEGKNEAVIYDIIVVPSMSKLPSYIKDVEMKIFEKEMERCEQIAKIAINNAKALRILYDLRERLI